MAASLGNANVNINNLNIITFIKDIYLSLKHLDVCFNSFRTDIDSRMVKLEGQYETILERINQLHCTMEQIKEGISQSSNMDSTIEKELLDKMFKLSSAAEDSSRLELKPKELTFANILENGYTMLDINNSLTKNGNHGTSNGFVEPSNMNNLSLELSSLETIEQGNKIKTENTTNTQSQTLDSLLFD